MGLKRDFQKGKVGMKRDLYLKKVEFEWVISSMERWD